MCDKIRIDTCHLVFKTDKNITASASKLRGYIGNTFKDHFLLHNHFENNFIYSYPLIQYKIIQGQASILGIDEGAKLLKEISSDITELKLDKTYDVESKIIYESDVDVNTSNEVYHYKFITPWLALNEKNFQKYKDLSSYKESKVFLNKIIIGNILSMSKGLGVIVNRKLIVKSRLDPVTVKYKSVDMKGFTGEFKVKFRIPSFCGLGKGVSQGFGTIIPVYEER